MVLCMIGGYGIGWTMGDQGHFLAYGIRNPSHRLPVQIAATASMMMAAATVKRACVNALNSVGTKPTFEPVTKLATTGPYAYCRNSLYWTVLSIPGSLGLMLDSAWVAFGSNLALWLYLHFVVVPAEEKYLSKQLGDAYKKYCTNVKRWGFF